MGRHGAARRRALARRLLPVRPALDLARRTSVSRCSARRSRSGAAGSSPPAPPGSSPTYLLLRGLLRSADGRARRARSRSALLCAGAIPAMSWSPSRVGLGLGGARRVSAAATAPSRAAGSPATGALLGAALLYSQEVGIAGSLARRRGARAAVRSLDARSRGPPLGGAALLAPAVAYIAAQGALGATFDNLFLFPRVRMLGFGALPFPALAWDHRSLCAYLVPALLAVVGLRDGDAAARAANAARACRPSSRCSCSALLLFSAALSRPDPTHFAFAAPPALVLLAGLVEDAVALAAARPAPRRRCACCAAAVRRARRRRRSRRTGASSGANLVSSRRRRRPRGFRAAPARRAAAASCSPNDIAGDLEHLVAPRSANAPAPDEPIWVFPNEPLALLPRRPPAGDELPARAVRGHPRPARGPVAQLERVAPPLRRREHRHSAAVDGIAYDVALPEVLGYSASSYEVEADFGSFALLRRKI